MASIIIQKIFLSVGMVLSFTFTFAQLQSGNNELFDLLNNELTRAGASIEKSALRINLLAKEDSKQYGLLDKPTDAFHLKSNSSSVQIRSLSQNGLRNGVYWYLYQLGFRYYFPEPAWHHFPKLKSVFLSFDTTVTPSFTFRRIWYAYGTDSKKADDDFLKWTHANLLGGEAVNAGHAYDGIVKRNKEAFLQHPEYFAKHKSKGTIPKNPKFEVSNEKLVQLVINDALAQVKSIKSKTGSLPEMISMDPSDGGGFSTSAASMKIGTPSEQVFYLANKVAAILREKYPTVQVGLYAYNQHAIPPSFSLEPNIVVLVATAMNNSTYRTEELIQLWKKKGVKIGIRDYYGVMAWDWDMPGQPKGSRISSLRQLQEFYNSGVRLFTAETNIGWISRGLGHYIASRLLFP